MAIKKSLVSTISVGRMIVFEGIDGCGKDTQIQMISDYFINSGFKKVVILNAISDSETGNKLRYILSNPEEYEKISRLELCQMFIDDMKSQTDKIKDLISQGYFVFINRWIYSTLADNGLYGTGVSNIEALKDRKMIEEMAKDVIKPDLVVYLTLPPEEAIERINNRTSKPLDVTETLNNLNKVHKSYEIIMGTLPPDKYAYIESNKKVEKVHKDIIDAVNEVIGISREIVR